MKNKFTKKDYINEILRMCRTLTQCSYNSTEDRQIKTLIAENLAGLSKCERR